jgi:hypothetical protein
MTTHPTPPEEWLADALDTVHAMRDNGGELDLQFPIVLLPSNQRRLAQDLRDLRQFGYAFRTWRDGVGRIIRVRLLEQ